MRKGSRRCRRVGASLVEYAVIVALIAVGALASIYYLGVVVSCTYCCAGDALHQGDVLFDEHYVCVAHCQGYGCQV